MIAIKDMLPSDADEQAAIERILREQPDLSLMIERAQTKAREMFTNPRFSLDTHGYDDWNPQTRLVIRADVPEETIDTSFLEYVHWLAMEPGVDLDRLGSFPMLHAVTGSNR